MTARLRQQKATCLRLSARVSFPLWSIAPQNEEHAITRSDNIQLITVVRRFASVLALIITCVPLPVSATDASPSIAGIVLGMPVERARDAMRGLGISKIEEVRESKVDRTGDFVRAITAYASLREAMVVVFGEFTGEVIEVVRSQNFSPGSGRRLETVDAAVHAAYGVRLQGEGYTHFAVRLHDRGGAPTDDRSCFYTTVTPLGHGRLYAGLMRWREYGSRCGILIRVEASGNKDGTLVSLLTQHMADSRAVSDDDAKREALSKITSDNQVRAAAQRAEEAAQKPPRL